MFTLVEMKDTIKVPPWLFHIKLNEAIKEILNKKYANKVIHNVGLCIALWDISLIEDSYIFPGDGSSHTVVSVGFFDDIFIPSDSMQHPSRFDDSEQLWVWEYETEDGKHDLFMDLGEEIRFKVVDETFVDTSPTGPENGSEGNAERKAEGGEKKSPFILVVSVVYVDGKE